jgi:hypothetical protein
MSEAAGVIPWAGLRVFKRDKGMPADVRFTPDIVAYWINSRHASSEQTS